MSQWALIGGTGFDQLAGIDIERTEAVTTPFGEPSAALAFGRLQGHSIVFLPRHGPDHHLPPHRINYRANLWALQSAGVQRVIALAAVGGIAPRAVAGSLVIPDQIIDYTWGREHTYHDGQTGTLDHVDITHPYTPSLRARLLAAARAARLDVMESATYAATQGPRLETAAEIDRLERDGADIVGMTGMPEAGLARELGLDYAAIAIVVNAAAGRSDEDITLDLIRGHLEAASARVLALLGELSFDAGED